MCCETGRDDNKVQARFDVPWNIAAGEEEFHLPKSDT